VRTLAEDIGERLGCRRASRGLAPHGRPGPFGLEQAVTFDALEPLDERARDALLHAGRRGALRRRRARARCGGVRRACAKDASRRQRARATAAAAAYAAGHVHIGLVNVGRGRGARVIAPRGEPTRHPAEVSGATAWAPE
jgi:tRNA U55 pseudouridine synthase TruB